MSSVPDRHEMVPQVETSARCASGLGMEREEERRSCGVAACATATINRLANSHFMFPDTAKTNPGKREKDDGGQLGHAAVHANHLAGDVGRRVGAKESHRSGYVLRFA